MTTKLWAGVKLPAWDADRLYALYIRYNSGTLSAAQRDEYARLLMLHIAMRFASARYDMSLARARLDPDDVAQDLLMFLLRKTALESFTLSAPCVKVLMHALNQSIYFFVMSKIRTTKRIRDNVTESEWSATHTLDASFTRDERDSTERLADALREQEDTICRDVPGDIFAICDLFQHQVDRIAAGEGVVAHARLPRKLQAKISREQHMMVTTRLNRFVGDYAAGLSVA